MVVYLWRYDLCLTSPLFKYGIQRTWLEICSTLTIKTPEWRTGDFEHISHLVLTFLLLTLSRKTTTEFCTISSRTFRVNPVTLIVYEMIKNMLKVLQRMLQELERMFVHFVKTKCCRVKNHLVAEYL